ncbi:type II secretion system F family protein [Microlunatus soli]|uniref:Tight adherence protein B n=1 Tax=Microlunatus soli TaxID=630515 RepID=A0A1H1SYQ9_9ACTN|nr:hypothetical protein [Microlunatus soli]SDS52846.1 tight adherence protein B [Microlunatus soli]
MIIFTVLVAGLAAAIAVRPPLSRIVLRRLSVEASEIEPRRRRRIHAGLVVPATLAIGVPALIGLAWGRQAFWLCVPIMIMAGTGWVIIKRALRRRRAADNSREVAQACAVLAAQVRIGQPPLVALRSAAQDCPVLRPAVATADLGGDMPNGWLRQSREAGRAGLADLARAWRLSSTTGSGMAEALDDVSEALVADESLGLVIGSEAAGPRASGKVMAALPLVGVALGYLIGGDPLDFLINSGAGWACLIAGAALAAAGVLWMERVADHASGGR